MVCHQGGAPGGGGSRSRLNRAGYMIAVGIRSLFVAVPLVFWLFGPAFLVIATIGLLIVLYRLDRNQIII